MNILVINNYKEFHPQANTQSYVIFLCSTPWCPPCENTKRFLKSIPNPMEQINNGLGDILRSFIGVQIESMPHSIIKLQVLLKNFIMDSINRIFKNIHEGNGETFTVDHLMDQIRKLLYNLINNKYQQYHTELEPYINELLTGVMENIQKNNIDLGKNTLDNNKKLILHILEESYRDTATPELLEYTTKIEQLYQHIYKCCTVSLVITDIDEHKEVATKYNVRTIPTFVVGYIDKNGNVEYIGNCPGSINNTTQLQERFKSILGHIFTHSMKQYKNL